MIKHVQIKVTGRVQGVNFRYATQKRAAELGVSGFVRNEPDGSVYIEAEGEEGLVDQLTKWCKRGPPRADVSGVEVISADLKGFRTFEIAREPW
jgi:acylphosphatase